jgi:uncharacterized protein YaaR (DUF327 family)
VREQRDFVDEDELNTNSSPADVINFISKQIKDMGDVLKDDQICKVVKRLKKMVSGFILLLSLLSVQMCAHVTITKPSCNPRAKINAPVVLVISTT